MAIAILDIQPVLIEQVENRLIEAIVDGSLPAGHRLTQESAAGMLGVSRQPVSHALQALKRRGLLVEHGKRGLAVAPLDGQRIRDLYVVRAALDAAAAEHAARRMRTWAVDPNDVQTARTALARGQALGAHVPMLELIGADVAFHSALHALSGNHAIVETIAAQWPHFMRSMAIVLEDAEVRDRAWREHAAILDAVLLAEASKAADLARAHTLRAGEDTACRIERQCETPKRGSAP